MVEDKVICIENIDIKGEIDPHFTLNEVYNLKIEDTVYIINSSRGISVFMDKTSYKHFFVTLQKHRENQLKLIGI